MGTMGEDRVTKEQMRNEKSKILIMEASYSISQQGMNIVFYSHLPI